MDVAPEPISCQTFAPLVVWLWATVWPRSVIRIVQGVQRAQLPRERACCGVSPLSVYAGGHDRTVDKAAAIQTDALEPPATRRPRLPSMVQPMGGRASRRESPVRRRAVSPVLGRRQCPSDCLTFLRPPFATSAGTLDPAGPCHTPGGTHLRPSLPESPTAPHSGTSLAVPAVNAETLKR